MNIGVQLLPDRSTATLQVSPGLSLQLRRFGDRLEDLNVDFNQCRPELVTDVLATTMLGTGAAREKHRMLSELSLSSRIVSLLLLTRLNGSDILSVELRCPNAGCAELSELDIDIDEVLDSAPADAEECFDVVLDGASLRVRRPTANDQLAWLASGFRSVVTARTAMVRSLVASDSAGELSTDWIDALETELDEHDPLMRFCISVVCPGCGVAHIHEIGLTDLALRILRAEQARLIESVHRLATRYGWREHEVLALPAWRRERYLALVGAAVAG